jgi:uncharacterized membrane protein
MFEFSFREFTSEDALLAIIVLALWIVVFSKRLSFYFIRYIKDRKIKDLISLFFTIVGVVLGALVIFNFLLPML